MHGRPCAPRRGCCATSGRRPSGTVWCDNLPLIDWTGWKQSDTKPATLPGIHFCLLGPPALASVGRLSEMLFYP